MGQWGRDAGTVTPWLYDQLTDEDNLTWVKAMFACAGGVGRITQHERDWVLGYHTAAGDAEWVLEAIRTFDGVDRIEDRRQRYELIIAPVLPAGLETSARPTSSGLVLGQLVGGQPAGSGRGGGRSG